MINKLLITIFLFSLINVLQAQTEYKILRIDSEKLETMNVIYLKKQLASETEIFRIVTRKTDTLIPDKKKVVVGDVLRLNLVKSRNEANIKHGHVSKSDENSFFKRDFYDGKVVDISYHCKDLIGLYYIATK